MDRLLQDLRDAVRTLTTQKGFSLVVVLTLALAVAASSTIFTMTQAMLFRLLPIDAPDEFAFLWSTNPQLGRVRAPLSYPDYAAFRDGLTSFDGLAAMTTAQLDLTGLDQPARLEGFRVSANLFSTMGLSPLIGRVFSPQEDSPAGEHVAILGHGAWKRRFGADRGIVGRQIVLDGNATTVVGVMPPELELGMFRDVEIWTPLAIDENRVGREVRTLMVLGRLRPDVSVEEARAEVETIAERLEHEYASTNAGWGAFAVPVIEGMVGSSANLILFLLMMTGAFVLLIACSNVANLLLARSSVRKTEIAVRTALGATRARLVRQSLTESILVSLAAGALGLLLTDWTLRLLVEITRRRIPFFVDLGIDRNVFLFTLGLTLVTPIVFGLLPALRASKLKLSQELKEAGGRFGRGRHRSRSALVAAQASLALVLLVVAALTIRSVRALHDMDPGFDTENLLTFRLDVRSASNDKDNRTGWFFNELEGKLQSLPGIEAAALASHRPIVSAEPNRSFTIEGRPSATSTEQPWAATVAVSADFFSTLRVPIISGRQFTFQDSSSSPLVAIVSRRSVERYWQGGDPVGQRVRLGDPGSDTPWIEIVGVVGDVRNPDADQPPEPHIYLPFSQSTRESMAVMARTTGAPLTVLPSVRATIWQMNPDQTIYDTRTMKEILYDDVAGSFVFTSLMGYFALVALGLATSGVFGVVSYFVSERRHEIGVRIALGARVSDVMIMVMRRGLMPVLFGLGLGMLGAFSVSRAMGSMLYGVSRHDPLTFVGIPLVLVIVALVASLAPALRAARIDPIITLRHE